MLWFTKISILQIWKLKLRENNACSKLQASSMLFWTAIVRGGWAHVGACYQLVSGAGCTYMRIANMGQFWSGATVQISPQHHRGTLRSCHMAVLLQSVISYHYCIFHVWPQEFFLEFHETSWVIIRFIECMTQPLRCAQTLAYFWSSANAMS